MSIMRMLVPMKRESSNRDARIECPRRERVPHVVDPAPRDAGRVERREPRPRSPVVEVDVAAAGCGEHDRARADPRRHVIDRHEGPR
jgi:hypothetical protein